MMLLRCEAIPSALLHYVLRSATLKWEYGLKGALVQDADASYQEDGFFQMFHPQPAAAVPFE